MSRYAFNLDIGDYNGPPVFEISGEDSAIYTGSSAEFKVNGMNVVSLSGGSTGVCGGSTGVCGGPTGLPVPQDYKLEYCDKDFDWLPGTPINAGKYKIKAIIPKYISYENVESEPFLFTITKATPTANDFIFEIPTGGFVCDGSVKEPTIYTRTVGMGNFDVKYYKVGETTPLSGPPRDVGDYVFIIRVDGTGTNYEATDQDLTNVSWRFSIIPAKDNPSQPTQPDNPSGNGNQVPQMSVTKTFR